jgi:hypothetical protein
MAIQPNLPAGGLTGPTLGRVPRPVSEQGHPHGRPISWVLVGTVLTAFVVGGLALIANAWWLMAICGAIVLLAIPVGAAIHIMSDTVGWTGVMPSEMNHPHLVREASRLYEKEHPHD